RLDAGVGARRLAPPLGRAPLGRRPRLPRCVRLAASARAPPQRVPPLLPPRDGADRRAARRRRLPQRRAVAGVERPLARGLRTGAARQDRARPHRPRLGGFPPFRREARAREALWSDRLSRAQPRGRGGSRDVDPAPRRGAREFEAARASSDAHTSGCTTPLSREDRVLAVFSLFKTGGVLLSREVALRVPSALAGLTSLFGMGRGVSPPLSPPKFVGNPVTDFSLSPGRVDAHPQNSIATTPCSKSRPRAISTGPLNAL